jgi:hypothetical protein
MAAGLKIFFCFPMAAFSGAGGPAVPKAPGRACRAAPGQKWTLVSINLNLPTLCSNALIYTPPVFSLTLLIYYFYSKLGRGR